MSKANPSPVAKKAVLNSNEWKVFTSIVLSFKATEAMKLKALESTDVNAHEEKTGDTALIKVCREVPEVITEIDSKNRALVVTFLLRQNANPNKFDKEGFSPLYWAAHYSYEICKSLIKAKAEVNPPNPKGARPEINSPPLFAAAVTNQVKTADLLIENKANAQAENAQGSSVLAAAVHSSATTGNTAIVQSVLKAGAPVDIGIKGVETPLDGALRLRSVATVEVLLKANANTNVILGGFSTLHRFVCSIGSDYDPTIEKLILLLVAYKARINQLNQGQTVLYEASKNNNLLLVQLLLRLHADPLLMVTVIGRPLNTTVLPANDRDASSQASARTALTKLAKKEIKGRKKVATELPAPRANKPKAASSPNYSVPRYLKNNLLVNCTAMHIATLHNHYSIVLAFLDARVDPNVADSNHTTPLHIACDLGYFELTSLLLNRGANGNAVQDSSKMTPLHAAAQKGCSKTLSVLVKESKQLNLNAKDYHDQTALHAVSEKGDLPTVRLLVEGGANVDAVTDENATAIFFAARMGHAPIVEYLFKRGANPEILCHDGSSPLSAAYHYKHFAVMAVLAQDYYALKFPGSTLTLVMCINAVNPKKTVEAPVSDAKTAHEEQSEAQVQNAFSFLMARGFSRELIHAMRKHNKNKTVDGKETVDNPMAMVGTMMSSPVSWYDQSISSDTPGVVAIESTTTPHCFFYLSVGGLRQQDCDEDALQLFQKIPLRFCAPENEQGIKTLSNPIAVTVSIEGKLERVELRYELKHMKGESRVLCYTQLANDGRSTLILGAVYCEDGLHNTKDVRRLEKSITPIPVYLPPRLENYVKGVVESLCRIGLLNHAKKKEADHDGPGMPILAYCDLLSP